MITLELKKYISSYYYIKIQSIYLSDLGCLFLKLYLSSSNTGLKRNLRNHVFPGVSSKSLEKYFLSIKGKSPVQGCLGGSVS